MRVGRGRSGGLRSSVATLAALALTSALAACNGVAGQVSFKPIGSPVEFSIDTNLHVSVSIKKEVEWFTPLGTLSVGAVADADLAPDEWLVAIQTKDGDELEAFSIRARGELKVKVLRSDVTEFDQNFTERRTTVRASAGAKVIVNDDIVEVPVTSVGESADANPNIARCPRGQEDASVQRAVKLAAVPLTRLLGQNGATVVGARKCLSVPVLSDSSAVLVSVRATGASRDGHITAFECGAKRPAATTVSVNPGRANWGQAIVALGPDHRVCVYSSVRVEMTVDLLATFGTDGAGVAGGERPVNLIRPEDIGRDVQRPVPVALAGSRAIFANVTIRSGRPGTMGTCDRPTVPLFAFEKGVTRVQALVPTPEAVVCLRSTVDVELELSTNLWFAPDEARALQLGEPSRLNSREEGGDGSFTLGERDDGALNILMANVTIVNPDDQALTVSRGPSCGRGRPYWTFPPGSTTRLAIVAQKSGSTLCYSPDREVVRLLDWWAW